MQLTCQYYVENFNYRKTAAIPVFNLLINGGEIFACLKLYLFYTLYYQYVSFIDVYSLTIPTKLLKIKKIYNHNISRSFVSS
jgi:hypothetical protein